MMKPLPDKSSISSSRVTVLGAGRSGMASAKILSRHGGCVFLSEQAAAKEKRQEIKRLEEMGVQFEFGGHTDRVFDADWWVVSPGIPMTHALIQKARERSVPIIGELELASWFSKAPMVAVTGSNGKSTVTALIGHIFKIHGTEVRVVGNIGDSFAEYVEDLDEDGVAVVEVSSFQMETIIRFRPRVAVFLNLTPDHIDRHGSMQEYGRLKARIFENQTASDAVVYNGIDPLVVNWVAGSKGWRVVFGIEMQDRVCGFIEKNGLVILDMASRRHRLVETEAMSLKGEHNRLNCLAAALACHVMGVKDSAITEGLTTFRALPHRMEFIRTLDGVDWVNDSKATNVDSVWYALGSYDRPVILIAGGKDKDSDFTRLRPRILERVRAVVLIGKAAEKMAESFQKTKPIHRADSLQDAVEKARELAHRGDVVLLSPACASFDMFRNFEDRGDQFKEMVRRLR